MPVVQIENHGGRIDALRDAATPDVGAGGPNRPVAGSSRVERIGRPNERRRCRPAVVYEVLAIDRRLAEIVEPALDPYLPRGESVLIPDARSLVAQRVFDEAVEV